MEYVLGQYNKKRDNTVFVENIPNVEAATAVRDRATTLSEMSLFEDEFLFLGSGNTFDINTHYYFHGKIKKLASFQTFYIKLVDMSNTAGLTQYIKTIEVSEGLEFNTETQEAEWVDIEFVFTPLSSSFNAIMFQLQRTPELDFKPIIDSQGQLTYKGRYAKIAYEELVKINNVMGKTGTGIPENAKIIKLGIQSRPGILMCINGEEIRTSKTGIYEIKNGLITVNFFSVVSAAKESNNVMQTYMNQVNTGAIDTSDIFIAQPKSTRTLDGFTLDYMYGKQSS